MSFLDEDSFKLMLTRISLLKSIPTGSSSRLMLDIVALVLQFGHEVGSDSPGIRK